MISKDYKEVTWTWTAAIVLAHIIAYYNSYLSLDQVVTCVLAYPAIAVLIISMIED
jgi:hypothetical protein